MRIQEVVEGEALYEVWDVDGDPTETLTFPADAQFASSPAVLLVIPGNPGVIQYYDAFMRHIWSLCKGRIEVVGVQHPGHSASLRPTRSPLSLAEQVKHKVAVMDMLREKYPRANTTFFLAGHSIGAYMCLQVLRHRPDLPIRKCYALFPTLRDIASTPRGRSVSIATLPVLRHFAVLVLLLLRLLLPRPQFLRVTSHATGMTGRALEVTCDRLLRPSPAWHATSLGRDEMVSLRALDSETMRRNAGKVVVLYGDGDGWTPDHHVADMRRDHPDVEVHVCEVGVPHAFVLAHSEVVGDVVGNWVRKEMGWS
ncbi:hypothetical protein HK101_007911 [Irineochytrium annulatum]|nr:hypothetical protein HK101_007911 [Irineochytrium annulatum]